MAEITSPLKAIRAKCRDCCCDQLDVIKHCPIPDCPLFPFRMGKNPYVTRKPLTEEQKAKITARLAKARSKREKELEEKPNEMD